MSETRFSIESLILEMIPEWKSRENATLAYHLSQSRAVQTAKGIYYIDACLFYLGRAKFPDRMASRTAPVPKPIYKHAGVTLAIQARRFVDRHELSRILPRSIHMF